ETFVRLHRARLFLQTLLESGDQFFAFTGADVVTVELIQRRIAAAAVAGIIVARAIVVAGRGTAVRLAVPRFVGQSNRLLIIVFLVVKAGKRGERFAVATHAGEMFFQ